MKYLKKFESFDLDLGTFSEDEEDLNMNPHMMEEEEECAPCSDDEDDDNYDEYTFSSELENEDDDNEDDDEDVQAHRIRRWGDEVVEKKKVNAGLQAYLDKKAGKKEDKEEKDGKKAKPDFLDLDKDGDKKETMKKAAKDAKGGKEEEKGGKGLTAAQKKLPAGLQKAIAAKKK